MPTVVGSSPDWGRTRTACFCWQRFSRSFPSSPLAAEHFKLAWVYWPSWVDFVTLSPHRRANLVLSIDQSPHVHTRNISSAQLIPGDIRCVYDWFRRVWTRWQPRDSFRSVTPRGSWIYHMSHLHIMCNMWVIYIGNCTSKAYLQLGNLRECCPHYHNHTIMWCGTSFPPSLERLYMQNKKNMASIISTCRLSEITFY